MKLSLLLFFSFVSGLLGAQKPAKNLYVELGGNGMAFNVMYESRFKPGNSGAGFKIGAGGFSTTYEDLFSIPFGVNWLLGKDNKHFFEAGVGATFLHYNYDYEYWGGYSTDEYPIDVVNLTVDSKNSVYGHLTLGYRRQPADGGFMWGAAITPHFNQNGFWPLWVGVKVGYAFGSTTKPDK